MNWKLDWLFEGYRKRCYTGRYENRFAIYFWRKSSFPSEREVIRFVLSFSSNSITWMKFTKLTPLFSPFYRLNWFDCYWDYSRELIVKMKLEYYGSRWVGKSEYRRELEYSGELSWNWLCRSNWWSRSLKLKYYPFFLILKTRRFDNSFLIILCGNGKYLKVSLIFFCTFVWTKHNAQTWK